MKNKIVVLGLLLMLCVVIVSLTAGYIFINKDSDGNKDMNDRAEKIGTFQKDAELFDGDYRVIVEEEDFEDFYMVDGTYKSYKLLDTKTNKVVTASYDDSIEVIFARKGIGANVPKYVEVKYNNNKYLLVKNGPGGSSQSYAINLFKIEDGKFIISDDVRPETYCNFPEFDQEIGELTFTIGSKCNSLSPIITDDTYTITLK